VLLSFVSGWWKAVIAAFLVLLGSAIFIEEKGGTTLKAIDELKVRVALSSGLPDPAKIESTGDWYVLDHISSGLSSFDSEKNRFVPMLAESWSTSPDGTHLFKLRSGIRFHDGTAITAKDVVWTLKRQLILKTSTHFPLWEYIDGCGSLKSLNDDCAGLRITDKGEVAIRLKMQTDTFFLQLASPETGIWSASDMDPETASLKPTKFSGPYYFTSETPGELRLIRNDKSLISGSYPNSPKAIVFKRIPLSQTDQALINHEVDLVVRSRRPLGEPDWKTHNIEIRSTPPSSMIYFFGTGADSESRVPLGRDLLEALWGQKTEENVFAAETFLPFASRYDLKREEFLTQLPGTTAKKIRVLCPVNFFAPRFLDFLQKSAKEVGSEFEFTFEPPGEWFSAFNDPKSSEKYDYILSLYAASERYPAVQLRYVTGTLTTPPIDLKPTESPDLNDDRISILKAYQKWLLKSRQAIPVYFTNTLFLHDAKLDLGKQPASDAEIELWRVQERVL
jgi:hypothetical protein